MGFLDFLNGFVQGAGSIGAQIQAIFAFLFSTMVALFRFLYKVLVDVANFLYDILKRVGRFFRYVWDKFFYGIFNRLFQKLLVFHDWLEAHLKPIIQFLQKVRAYIDRFFKLYIKPFLNLIQHIRRVLLIMRLLHIKFAQQLDSRLLRLEVKVAGVFIQARAVLNGLIDAVNVVLDPLKLLRHPVLIIALRRSLPALVRAVTGLPIGYFFPSRRAARGSEYMSPFLDGGPSLTLPATMPAPDAVSSFIESDSYLLPDGSAVADDAAPEPAPLDYFLEADTPNGDSTATVTLFGLLLLENDSAEDPAAIDLLDVADELTFGFDALVGAVA